MGQQATEHNHLIWTQMPFSALLHSPPYRIEHCITGCPSKRNDLFLLRV
jgi:hypothetical protein